MIRECLLRVRQFIIIIIFCCFFCKCVPRKRLFSNEKHWPIIKFFWMNSLRYLWNNHFRLSFFYEIIRRTCNNNSECIRHYIYTILKESLSFSSPPPQLYKIFYLLSCQKFIFVLLLWERNFKKIYIFIFVFFI